MKNCEPLVLGPALAYAQSDKEAREGESTTWAAAYHGEKEGPGMLDREGFILKLFTIDGFAAGSYITRKKMR
jgi:hypothetical protein